MSDALLARMAQWGVAIATTAPPSRPVPAVAACREAGVAIFGGCDGIRDTWGPYGRPDMLERAMLIGLRNTFRRDEEVGWAFDSVTTAASRTAASRPARAAMWCASKPKPSPRPWPRARRAGSWSAPDAWSRAADGYLMRAWRARAPRSIAAAARRSTSRRWRISSSTRSSSCVAAASAAATSTAKA